MNFYKKIAILGLLILVGMGNVSAQFSAKDTSVANRKNRLLTIPTLLYAKETRFQLGASGLYSFWFDKKDPNNRSSTAVLAGFITQNKQSTFTGYFNGWSKANKYHYELEGTYKKFPYNFYGVGAETKAVDMDPLLQEAFKFSAEGERRILKNLYTGLGLIYLKNKETDLAPGGIYTTDTTLKGRYKSTQLFLGVSGIFDNRDNANYATKGFSAKFNFQISPPGGFNTNYLYKLYSKLRYFIPINTRQTLGFNALYNGIDGSEVPYYFLSAMGSDQIMRGYYGGRYRNNQYTAVQTEYRWLIFKRFGIAAFAGGGWVYKSGILPNQDFKPNYGGGIRYVFDPASRLTFRLDYGIGEKRVDEKRVSGAYFYISEAF